MKRKAGLFIGLLLLMMSIFYVSVNAENLYHVYDEYDMLSAGEEAELEQELQEIYDTYGFDTVLLISSEVYENERNYAASFMQEFDVGYGDEKDGMCMLHQPVNRTITIVFRGQYQDDFSVEIQDLMLDDCTDALRENDIMKAYKGLADDLEAGLKRVTAGKVIRPVDMDGDGYAVYALKWLGWSFLIMIVPVLILLLVQISKMKTKVPQKNADFYSPRESFDLQICRDIYLRTDVKKRKIEKEGNGSGKSGSFTSGGESFSGSTRKY